MDDVAWYASSNGNGTRDVMTKNSNELGIYDMSGNVWEWCQDYWRANYSTTDYNTERRVRRGASWGDYARDCRVSRRDWCKPAEPNVFTGLRIAL